MSTDNTKQEASAEASKPPKEKPSKKSECPSASSPDGKHNIFHNEGTDEKYCRYCGKTG